MTTDRIERRWAGIQGRVARAAGEVGRDPADVEILPVTKGHPASVIEAVAALGFGAIGENRVPEAEAKREDLGGDLGLAWHMIGRLQRNKARRALALFDVIESVDSVRLAERLSRILTETGGEVEVLVEVNASGEEAKAGFTPDGAREAMEYLCRLPGLKVEGLMTMAPHTRDEDILRATFRRVRELSDRCRETVPGYRGRVLSMGMSNDFEIAIAEGSTRVRLGTALLGER